MPPNSQSDLQCHILFSGMLATASGVMPAMTGINDHGLHVISSLLSDSGSCAGLEYELHARDKSRRLVIFTAAFIWRQYLAC